MRNRMATFMVMTALIAAPLSVMAKKPDKDEAGRAQQSSEYTQQYSGPESNTRQYEHTGKRHGFDSRDQRIIREYYLGDGSNGGADRGKGKHKDKQLPPGLQKKLSRGGELPPGWEKKVTVGAVLDEELYSRSEPLSDELDRALGQVVGEEYRRIGNKVIRVLQGDATVIDVIDILDASKVLE